MSVLRIGPGVPIGGQYLDWLAGIMSALHYLCLKWHWITLVGAHLNKFSMQGGGQ